VSIIETNSENVVEKITTTNGKFNAELNPGDYRIVIHGDNYEAYTDELSIPENFSGNNFSYSAAVNPIQIEQEELLAEIIEEPLTELQVEQTIPIEKQEDEKIQEPIKEEPSEKQVVEEVSTPKKEETIPEKEIIKYVPKSSSSTTGKKSYSVQLMALKNPVEVDYFKDIDHVVLTKYPDGFYRYTVGNTTSYEEARNIKNEINKLGYKDAFIRINDELRSSYTIQIMALIIPVKPEYFKDLINVVVTKGADDYFRYTIGDYDSYEEAKSELNNIKSIGYSQAYVKKTNN